MEGRGVIPKLVTFYKPFALEIRWGPATFGANYGRLSVNYYYAINGQQNGPVSEEQLAALVAQGVVTGDTLVWREGMERWEPYAKIAPGGPPSTAGTAAAEASPTAASSSGAAATPDSSGTALVECSVCHGSFSPDQTIKYGTMMVCAGCKPRFLQGLREGTTKPTAALNYAEAGPRIVAKILDIVIGWGWGFGMQMLALNLGRGSVMSILVYTVSFLVGLAYVPVMLAWRGQTLGKIVMKIRVVNPDGSKINGWKAVGRWLSEFASACICGIGYIFAFFDEERRALHDRIASTRVVSVNE